MWPLYAPSQVGGWRDVLISSPECQLSTQYPESKHCVVVFHQAWPHGDDTLLPSVRIIHSPVILIRTDCCSRLFPSHHRKACPPVPPSPTFRRGGPLVSTSIYHSFVISTQFAQIHSISCLLFDQENLSLHHDTRQFLPHIK